MSADNSQSRISYLEIKIQILEQKYKSEIEKVDKISIFSYNCIFLLKFINIVSKKTRRN